ncbi:MAG: hypothetical protein WAN43_14125 [Rhodomicrobium sp.]|jgi:hypothetical protein
MRYRHVFGLFAIVCLLGAGYVAWQTPAPPPPAFSSRSLTPIKKNDPLQERVDRQGREIAALKEMISHGAELKLSSAGDLLSLLGLLSGALQMLVYVFLGGKYLFRLIG